MVFEERIYSERENQTVMYFPAKDKHNPGSTPATTRPTQLQSTLEQPPQQKPPSNHRNLRHHADHNIIPSCPLPPPLAAAAGGAALA